MFPPFPSLRAKRLVFLKEKLIEQLGKELVAQATLTSNGRNYAFGDPPNVGVSASVEVNDLSFFRKACLGGSLGVADSYADGDWDSPDLVSVFRFFLQNQKIMDGMEVGWATLLNKIARWSYLLGQKNTIQGSRKNISSITIWGMHSLRN